LMELPPNSNNIMIMKFPVTLRRFVWLSLEKLVVTTNFLGQSYDQRSKEAKIKETKASCVNLLSFSSCSHIDMLSRNPASGCGG
jgi:hypothetical protein